MSLSKIFGGSEYGGPLVTIFRFLVFKEQTRISRTCKSFLNTFRLVLKKYDPGPENFPNREFSRLLRKSRFQEANYICKKKYGYFDFNKFESSKFERFIAIIIHFHEKMRVLGDLVFVHRICRGASEFRYSDYITLREKMALMREVAEYWNSKKFSRFLRFIGNEIKMGKFSEHFFTFHWYLNSISTINVIKKKREYGMFSTFRLFRKHVYLCKDQILDSVRKNGDEGFDDEVNILERNVIHIVKWMNDRSPEFIKQRLEWYFFKHFGKDSASMTQISGILKQYNSLLLDPKVYLFFDEKISILNTIFTLLNIIRNNVSSENDKKIEKIDFHSASKKGIYHQLCRVRENELRRMDQKNLFGLIKPYSLQAFHFFNSQKIDNSRFLSGLEDYETYTNSLPPYGIPCIFFPKRGHRNQNPSISPEKEEEDENRNTGEEDNICWCAFEGYQDCGFYLHKLKFTTFVKKNSLDEKKKETRILAFVDLIKSSFSSFQKKYRNYISCRNQEGEEEDEGEEDEDEHDTKKMFRDLIALLKNMSELKFTDLLEFDKIHKNEQVLKDVFIFFHEHIEQITSFVRKMILKELGFKNMEESDSIMLEEKIMNLKRKLFYSCFLEGEVKQKRSFLSGIFGGSRKKREYDVHCGYSSRQEGLELFQNLFLYHSLVDFQGLVKKLESRVVRIKELGSLKGSYK